MTDVHTREQRSYNMSRIQGRDTKPELIVRSLVHQMGLRFRLHRRDLPGRPDLVLPRHQKIIFVHGCFWHMHRCRLATAAPDASPPAGHARVPGGTVEIFNVTEAGVGVIYVDFAGDKTIGAAP